MKIRLTHLQNQIMRELEETGEEDIDTLLSTILGNEKFGKCRDDFTLTVDAIERLRNAGLLKIKSRRPTDNSSYRTLLGDLNLLVKWNDRENRHAMAPIFNHEIATACLTKNGIEVLER